MCNVLGGSGLTLACNCVDEDAPATRIQLVVGIDVSLATVQILEQGTYAIMLHATLQHATLQHTALLHATLQHATLQPCSLGADRCRGGVCSLRAFVPCVFTPPVCMAGCVIHGRGLVAWSSIGYTWRGVLCMGVV